MGQAQRPRCLKAWLYGPSLDGIVELSAGRIMDISLL